MAIIQLLNDGTISINGLEAGSDASNVSFTPQTLGNWTGSADPGQTDDALDQIASRVQTLEGAGGGGGGGYLKMWVYDTSISDGPPPYFTTETNCAWAAQMITDTSYFNSASSQERLLVADATKNYALETLFNASRTYAGTTAYDELIVNCKRYNSSNALQETQSVVYQMLYDSNTGESRTCYASFHFPSGSLTTGDYFIITLDENQNTGDLTVDGTKASCKVYEF